MGELEALAALESQAGLKPEPPLTEFEGAANLGQSIRLERPTWRVTAIT
jgi:hypothetical protein